MSRTATQARRVPPRTPKTVRRRSRAGPTPPIDVSNAGDQLARLIERGVGAADTSHVRDWFRNMLRAPTAGQDTAAVEAAPRAG